MGEETADLKTDPGLHREVVGEGTEGDSDLSFRMVAMKITTERIHCKRMADQEMCLMIGCKEKIQERTVRKNNRRSQNLTGRAIV